MVYETVSNNGLLPSHSHLTITVLLFALRDLDWPLKVGIQRSILDLDARYPRSGLHAPTCP